MYKEIYYIENGKPSLIKEGEFYDKGVFTDVQPPNGLYQPIHYDGNQWIGTPYEEWLANQPKPEPIKPDPLQKVASNLQIQLMKSNIAQSQLQKQNAQMMLEITKLKGGN